jgi:addiction module RelE/StbE family toxin
MGSKGRYEVDILPRAQKDLKDLKQDEAQAVREILQLEEDPLLGHSLQGSLRGVRALEFNLKGGGAYRAVYTIVDKHRVCVVFLVGSHERSTGQRSGDGLRLESGYERVVPSVNTQSLQKSVCEHAYLINQH